MLILVYSFKRLAYFKGKQVLIVNLVYVVSMNCFYKSTLYSTFKGIRCELKVFKLNLVGIFQFRPFYKLNLYKIRLGPPLVCMLQISMSSLQPIKMNLLSCLFHFSFFSHLFKHGYFPVQIAKPISMLFKKMLRLKRQPLFHCNPKWVYYGKVLLNFLASAGIESSSSCVPIKSSNYS